MATVRVSRSVLALSLLAASVACSGSSRDGGTAVPPKAMPSLPGTQVLSTSPAPQGDATAAAMRSYLGVLAAKKEFTGTALVIRHGEVLLRYAAGYADASNKIPNRPDTVFRLASVSKQFTAMLVLKQQDRGLLKLDDPICGYLVPTSIKTCPKDWKPITIREILVHTSGIPDISEMSDFFPKLGKPTTTNEIIHRFVDKPLDFAPGRGWKYSNSGYILAGAIIEKVTGQPYGTVLRDEITGPLRLTHTGYSLTSPPPGYAKGYVAPGQPAAPINGSQANAAGGVYSNADDLGRWDRSFGAHLVAPAATVKEALTSQVTCPSGGCLGVPSTGYAFGWLVSSINGHPYYSHPGVLEGYHASNGYLPGDDIAVAVLSNVQTTDVNGIDRKLATMALKS